LFQIRGFGRHKEAKTGKFEKKRVWGKFSLVLSFRKGGSVLYGADLVG